MISRERLYYYLDDYAIFEFYIGDFEIGGKMCSPVRDDSNPSFQIKQSSSGKLYWRDYGINQDYFDSVQLVAEMYGISREDAVNRIWKDIVLGDYSIKDRPEKKLATITLPYEYEYGDLTDFELDFWKKQLIYQPTLDKYNVKGLRGLYRGPTKLIESTELLPAFIYLFLEKDFCFKTYMPDGGIWKWRGQNNGDIIEGWTQLPEKADRLIITSSLKDTMTLDCLGLACCNPSSENSTSILVSKKDEINSRFKRVTIFFDNDKPGIVSAKKLYKETRWKPIMLPRGLNIKDPSDLVLVDGNNNRLKSFLKKSL